jgi:hypothetical protein
LTMSAHFCVSETTNARKSSGVPVSGCTVHQVVPELGITIANPQEVGHIQLHEARRLRSGRPGRIARLVDQRRPADNLTWSDGENLLAANSLWSGNVVVVGFTLHPLVRCFTVSDSLMVSRIRFPKL